MVKEKSGRAKKRKVVKSEDGSQRMRRRQTKRRRRRPRLAISSSASSSLVERADVVHFDSKLSTLVAELQAMRAASPTHKALVFTQYLSTMELLKRTMKEHDFTYQTLEGHMPMRQRKRNLEEFRSNPECAVFLLSMRSGAVGLTLTAASHVFILEPAINPALEQQAIGRIHRLGNTHSEVVVNYLVMAGSVEENLMEINREKLELLEKQKKKEEDRLARANGMRMQEEDDEEDANVRRAGSTATATRRRPCTSLRPSPHQRQRGQRRGHQHGESGLAGAGRGAVPHRRAGQAVQDAGRQSAAATGGRAAKTAAKGGGARRAKRSSRSEL